MDFLDVDKNLSTELTSQKGFFRERPSIFLAEGLIMYLGEGKKKLLKDISSIAASGSLLILNFCFGEMARAVDPTTMSFAELKDFLILQGWDEDSFQENRFGDDVLNYGRFPNEKYEPTNMFSFLVCRKK